MQIEDTQTQQDRQDIIRINKQIHYSSFETKQQLSPFSITQIDGADGIKLNRAFVRGSGSLQKPWGKEK
jgi:hypothetical protein